MIQRLIQSFAGVRGRDTLGVPLIEQRRMQAIWESQKKHVKCLQDPAGVALYTQTGTMKKGGVDLPVFRCARGSTSLECFHLHLNRFISGKITATFYSGQVALYLLLVYCTVCI
ncbi:hypothetical protein DPMN_090521 [Dreissena polymorpha]|uniref:Uncharacterized protein n=1 Tax=Dreissena polymorpha TaxID=45954 RepID=A0A9D4KYV7_DREPO|nr:hypothetical protein DPMN_090521 [Dreissena polymorpha]